MLWINTWAQETPITQEAHAGHCSPHFTDGQTEAQGKWSAGLRSKRQAVSKAETYMWHFHTLLLHVLKTLLRASSPLFRLTSMSYTKSLKYLAFSSSTPWAWHLRCTSYKQVLMVGSSFTLLNKPNNVSPSTGTWVWVKLTTSTLCKYRESTGGCFMRWLWLLDWTWSGIQITQKCCPKDFEHFYALITPWYLTLAYFSMFNIPTTPELFQLPFFFLDFKSIDFFQKKIVSIKIHTIKNYLRSCNCVLGTWLCPALQMLWQNSRLLEAHPCSAVMDWNLRLQWLQIICPHTEVFQIQNSWV